MIPKNPLSDRQLQANRDNAQKSCGPRTPEGKATSSLNALKHGLAAKRCVLPTEDPADYQLLAESYYRRFQPVNQLEVFMVESMASAAWRIQRANTIEAAHLAAEIADPDLFPPGVEFAAPAIHTAAAHRKLADNSNALHLAVRQIAAYTRELSRLIRDFTDLRNGPIPAAPAMNEPAPIDEPETVPSSTPEPSTPISQNKPIPNSGHSLSLEICRKRVEEFTNVPAARPETTPNRPVEEEMRVFRAA